MIRARHLSIGPLLVLAGCSTIFGFDGDYAETGSTANSDPTSPTTEGSSPPLGGGAPDAAPPSAELPADASSTLDAALHPDGEAGVTAPPPPSCGVGRATCGPLATDDCCRVAAVPGGTFDRLNRPSSPATVSAFALDVYEVTVARFRTFVQSGRGTKAIPPAAGAGASPSIPASGWKSSYDDQLPVNTAALVAELGCPKGTYTDQAGTNESRPVGCVSWYVAFAFCAWDGGRLPSEAEKSFAATGGSEQRVYPWSSPPASATIDSTYATYDTSAPRNVGAVSPKGDGRWGHADLAGNISEWSLDAYADALPTPCTDCVALSTPTLRVRNGGGFDENASLAKNDYRYGGTPGVVLGRTGLRCARPSKPPH